MFFGDRAAAEAYEQAIARAAALGAQIVEIDIEPFYETARLLYDGPWVAERYIVLKSLLASSPDSIHPVTRDIIVKGARPSAVDTFAAFYELEELRRVRDAVFQTIDALLLPTAPTVYTVEQVLADPIQLNSRLGTYTNFVNLLDLCGLAVPASMRPDGMPFGVTLLAPGGHDALLASIGRAFHADTGLPLGALGLPQPPLAAISPAPAADEIAIAVVGAHLSGMPLNGELKALGGRLLEATSTAPDYGFMRFPAATAETRTAPCRIGQGQRRSRSKSGRCGRKASAASSPPSPRRCRSARCGSPTAGREGLPGRGRRGRRGALDISSFGGWRNYLAQAKVPAA